MPEHFLKFAVSSVKSFRGGYRLCESCESCALKGLKGLEKTKHHITALSKNV